MTSSIGFAAFGVAMEGGGMLTRAMLNNVESTTPPSKITAAKSELAAAKENLNGVETDIETTEIEKEISASTKVKPADQANNVQRQVEQDLQSIRDERSRAAETGSRQEISSQIVKPEEVLSEVENGARSANALAAAEVPEAKIENPPALEISNGWEPDSRIKLIPQEDLPNAREVMLEELKSFEGGSQTNRFQLYKELMDMPWLTDAQKVRVTDVITQVRDYYAHLNTPDNPSASEAQRSWALSQASIADVINDTLTNAENGIKPDSGELENNILLHLFSQFRFHDSNESIVDEGKIYAEPESGARTILSGIGYANDTIQAVTDSLRREPLNAPSLDRFKYDADLLKKFEPKYRAELAHSDPVLKSESPIQQEWKSPSGEITQSTDNGALISKWSSDTGSGELVRNDDGTSIVSDLANNRRFAYSADGKITEASHVDTRQFLYSGSGELSSIESTELGRIYRSSFDGNWYQSRKGDVVESFSKVKVIADDDGSIRMLHADNSAVRVFRIDGSETLYPETGRPEFKSANYGYEKAILSDRIKTAFPEPARQERITDLIESFDKHASRRGLDDNSKALFYMQISRLLSDGDFELPMDSRRSLAEQAINHGAVPTTISQGQNNTCNVTTIENRIYTRSPQDIARMLADLAESGTFITHKGASIDLEHSISELKPDAEARQNMRLQNEGKLDIKEDGGRDWASQLAQTVMVKIKHLSTNEFVSKDTLVDYPELVFDKDKSLIGRVPVANIEAALDTNGNKLEALADGQDVYRKVGEQLEKVAPEDLVFRNRGQLRGVVSDRSKLTELYDYFGNRFGRLTPGLNYFDKDGNLAMYDTVPGDTTFDKLSSDSDSPKKPGWAFIPSDDAERLHTRHLGADIFLHKIVDGKRIVINGPYLNTGYYRDIANEVTGKEKAPFSIYRGVDHVSLYSAISVSSQAELEEEIVKMQNEGNLPGIVSVNTSNPPFNHKNGSPHVINLQSYDPVTKLVEYSNEWNSRFNAMGDKAIPLSLLFEAMRNPYLPVPPPVLNPPVFVVVPVPGSATLTH